MHIIMANMYRNMGKDNIELYTEEITDNLTIIIVTVIHDNGLFSRYKTHLYSDKDPTRTILFMGKDWVEINAPPNIIRS